MRSETEVLADLSAYTTAEKKILEGHQSWSIGGEQFARPNLKWIQNKIQELRQELTMVSASSNGYAPQDITFGGRR